MRTAILLVKKRREKTPETSYYENVGEGKLDYKSIVREADGSVSAEIELVQLWTSSRGVTKRKRFRTVSAIPEQEEEVRKPEEEVRKLAPKRKKASKPAAKKKPSKPAGDVSDAETKPSAPAV